MEHESFEDKEVAKLMNDSFINIKVDREEMPEIDHLYMTVCQAMTGRGGWPLTILMTPRKDPFFAGTYFPKNSSNGNPGLIQLIPSIVNAWSTKRVEVNKTIDNIYKYLIEINTSTQGDKWDEIMIHDLYDKYKITFDSDFGGFGDSPKFPSPHNLIFLLRYSYLYGDAYALKMVEKTLEQMRLGGIFDHIGFGFHRYSTDKRWFLPHFEKMLYDQAMLSIAFLEAYQFTGKKTYAKTAKEIFTYVLRDMTDKRGGFYSAEDADSDAEEGAFYLWKMGEITSLLGKKNGNIFASVYGLMNDGNFKDEATGMKNGKNILFIKSNRKNLAKKFRIRLDFLDKVIKDSRKILYDERKRRNHPLKDDKILTDWNGLMIAALSIGGLILNDKTYTNAAKKAADFVLQNLQTNSGKLKKAYRNKSSNLNGCLDDYSFMIWGLLNLYENSFDIKYLERAIALMSIMKKDFIDENGGFFISSKEQNNFIIRSKSIHDGAIPSGNSVAIMNLYRLGRITGNRKWSNLATKSLKTLTEQAKKFPTSFSFMFCGFMFEQENPRELLIVANSLDSETKDSIKMFRSKYLPNTVILLKTPFNEKGLIKISPWIKEHFAINGKPTFYVCKNFSCARPTTNIKSALNLLTG